uniref:Myb/SANT-like domain-containing protein n=1 Tax=Vitis vinifera TaxID=29760 RepID=A5BCJ9_VITVI|nr:hypothetical protein VITISV_015285 [Vitis vinifera]
MSSNKVQPLQQPSGEESEKQSKAYWDDITMDAFVKVCVAETLAGNRLNSHFSKLGWKNENPEAIKFKTKGLKNVEQLDLLFKDIVATGERAWAPSQGFVGQDVDDSSKNPTVLQRDIYKKFREEAKPSETDMASAFTTDGR